MGIYFLDYPSGALRTRTPACTQIGDPIVLLVLWLAGAFQLQEVGESLECLQSTVTMVTILHTTVHLVLRTY